MPTFVLQQRAIFAIKISPIQLIINIIIFFLSIFNVWITRDIQAKITDSIKTH